MDEESKKPNRVLTPKNGVQVPLDAFVREVAREAARETAAAILEQHVATCPGRVLPTRVSVVETKLAFLVGALVGSGFIAGGVAGAGLTWLLGG